MSRDDDHTEWVKGWVESINKQEGHGLTPKEVQKAAVIGNAGFTGNVGVGHAAKAGIDAVKKLRE
jgi:hypothetical protein